VALVNLAGIACPVALHEIELEEFERVMAVNVTGSYLMLKAAVIGMCRGGARELGPFGITVNVVAPGPCLRG
jgi:NAD(P)-dependent dehydrogenase (short-subunit alcohol dehydrogenase family)